MEEPKPAPTPASAQSAIANVLVSSEPKEVEELDTTGWTEIRPLGARKKSQRVRVGGDAETVGHNNMVRTTRYTMFSFLPRSFLLQFRRVGNVFFTFIVVVMLLGNYTKLFPSPQKPWGNIFVVAAIFALNMASEFFDDRKRAANDKAVNGQSVWIYLPESGKFEKTTWGDVKTGDLVRLERGNSCPADLLLLTTSNVQAEPVCYVQTANLDGETYLKKRVFEPRVYENCDTVENTVKWLDTVTVLAHKPDPSLSKYEVIITYKRHDVEDSNRHINFGKEHAIFRGMELRNTAWILGLVTYAGRDTKALMASGSTKIKQSKVDQVVNKVITSVLIMLVALLLISVSMLLTWTPAATTLWYLKETPESSGSVLSSGFSLLLVYLVLYRQILPILLYAVQDGLNKLQGKYISWDLKMRDPETGRFASCNSTALAQEIGQVKWIFSDKTGTLTKNEMRLVACSIGSRIYGHSRGAALERLGTLSLAPRESLRLCFADIIQILHPWTTLHFNLEGLHRPSETRPIPKFNKRNGQARDLDKLLRALSLCHTVLIETSERNDATQLMRRSSFSSLGLSPNGSSLDLNDEPRSPLLSPVSSRSQASLLSSFSEFSPGSPPLATRSPITHNSQPFTHSQKPPRLEGLKQVEDDEPLNYNAESPDELALVLGAAALGYEFAYTKGPNVLGVRRKEVVPGEVENGASENKSPSHSPEPFYSTRGLGARELESEEWEVVVVNPFSSTRKRMSVLYRNKNDPRTATLYCKGADNQMLAAADLSSFDLESTKVCLQEFSKSGLRTLVVGQRHIGAQELDRWLEQYSIAEKLTGEVQKKELDRVASEIERDLEILGVTAVEDRLQDGVPQTVDLLREAKINFWLITGDKVETAINISRSANLISSESELIVITEQELQQTPLVSDGMSAASPSHRKQVEQQSKVHRNQLHTLILEQIQRLEQMGNSGSENDAAEGFGFIGAISHLLSPKTSTKEPHIFPRQNVTMIVDGEILRYILRGKPDCELEAAFLTLSRMCGVVVACRTSPAQKAQLVALVKDNVKPTPTTLAIGDGANDVPMIEMGHIGVGIAGKEGTHATTASDFSIGQFRFLGPLLLVHGRSGYIRIAKAISLTFYSNLLFTFTGFLYNILCRFSGTPAFTNFQFLIFQAFIAVPVFVIGGTDRDFDDPYDVLNAPRAYDVGRLNKILHPAFVDAQILRSLAHGSVALSLVFWGNSLGSYQTLYVTLFFVLTFVMTIRQARLAAAKTWYHLFALAFNVLGVLAVSYLMYGANFHRRGKKNDMRNENGRVLWIQLFTSMIVVVMLDFLLPKGFIQMRKRLKGGASKTAQGYTALTRLFSEHRDAKQERDEFVQNFQPHGDTADPDTIAEHSDSGYGSSPRRKSRMSSFDYGTPPKRHMRERSYTDPGGIPLPDDDDDDDNNLP